MRFLPAILLLAACSPGVPTAKDNVVELSVTAKGFEPSPVKVAAGRPVKLVVTRKTDDTCATEIVIKDYGVKAELPLNQATTVTFTPTKTGELRYSCAMGMFGGVLRVE